MNTEKIRIFIVDDTAVYRSILKKVFDDMPNVEVVGTAPNGKIALEKMAEIRPDIVTLDQEMPEMNGLETLRRLKGVSPDTIAVMISAHTTEGAYITIKALQLGAFDFITKTSGGSYQENIEKLTRQFHPVLRAVLNRRTAAAPIPDRSPQFDPPAAVPKFNASNNGIFPKIVAIGISTGGPNALSEVIPKLPGDFHIPIVIVQHMPPVFTKALAESLNQKSHLNVVEGKSGDSLQAGWVYIAPGGKQLKIVKHQETKKPRLLLTNDAPENHCRPSADYLFRSVAEVYKNQALGLIMTGMGTDGTAGLKLMKQNGATIMAQDKESSVVFGMPMEAIKAGIVDQIVPLDRIAGEVLRKVSVAC